MSELAVVRDGALFLAQPSTPLGWNVISFGAYEPELRHIFRHVLRPGAGYRLFGIRRNWLEPFQANGAWPACPNFWAVPVTPAPIFTEGR